MATSTTGSTLLQPLSNAVRLPVDQVRMGRRLPRRCLPGACRGGAAPRRASAPAPLRAVPPRPIPLPAAPPSSPPPPGGGWATPGGGGGAAAVLLTHRRLRGEGGATAARAGAPGRGAAAALRVQVRSRRRPPRPAPRRHSPAAARSSGQPEPGPGPARLASPRRYASSGRAGVRPRGLPSRPGWPTCWHPPPLWPDVAPQLGTGPVSAQQCKGWVVIANAEQCAVPRRACHGFFKCSIK